MARVVTILDSPPRSRRRYAPSFPQPIEPMLATAGMLPADEQHFAFEPKWDGVRAVVYWDGRRLAILSRNGIDITSRYYPELAEIGSELGKTPAIVDGEIVALDEQDRPSFPLLQHRMHVSDPKPQLVARVPALWVPFDLLYSGTRSLLTAPYEQRRALLEKRIHESAHWRVSPSQVGDGRLLLSAVQSLGMEGVVAKRLGSDYQPGRRSADWIKVKIVFEQELVVGGWIGQTDSHDQRVGSLLVGYYAKAGDAVLRFAGGVGTGFTAQTHAMLTRKLQSIGTDRSPFDPRDRLPRGAHFVKPRLVAQVEFRRWPVGGQLHQAAFKGLRLDKDAGQVVREELF